MSDVSSSRAMSSLLAPLEWSTFVEEFWGQRMLYVPASPDKFKDLFSWHELNEILANQRIESPRLRLVLNGREIDPRSYRRKPGIEDNGSVLRSAEMLQHLSAGATLILDELDAAVESVRAVVVGLESELRVSVHSNLYAGWKAANAFPVHWDPHDTFVIQIAGRKSWTVWNPTRLFPLYSDVEASSPPTEEPCWQGELNPGSLLYMPRGWWHVAFPVNEPTLHITVSVNNRTGIDLLRWTVNSLRESSHCRRDVPQLATREDRVRYIAELRRILVDALDDTVIDAYIDNNIRARGTRPQFSFPALTTR
jgi:ribosomal protein L16 Arg81 hydroxylase